MRCPCKSTTPLPVTGQPALQACVLRKGLHQVAVGSDVPILLAWASPV